jgi:capsular polysaccharide biosynthesis protein
VRKILNESEIEDLFQKRGFTTVEAERLTFSEQVALFSQADILVGGSGAAMANLVFCPPTTKILIFISKFPDTSYWYWQNIACAIGNRVTYVLGPIEQNKSAGIHADYSINPADALNALEALS